LKLYNVPGVGKLAPGTPFNATYQFANEDGSVFADEIKFPANWLELATPEDLTLYSITVEKVPDPPGPTA
jgi:hypothetical protein